MKRNQERIEAACLERDLAAYECAGVLRALKEAGALSARSHGHAALARYAAANAELDAASGVRQVPAEVPA